jgi:hypothetical protein
MRKHFALLLLAISVGLASGCAGMTKNWSQAMPWGEKPSQIVESKYQAPVKLVALWSPAMYNAPGKKPTRGFGGRFYFYNAKNETVPVQGQLVVYCFDDTNKTSDHKQADRRVAFTPEQFSGHFSATELGASYSVWVPWDAVGNPQAEVSLVPIFTAATGQVIVGQQSLGLLPGPETPIQEKRVEERVLSARMTQDGEVTRVGFDEEINPNGIRRSSIQSMSITLPQSLAERVAASRNQEVQVLPEPKIQPPTMLPQSPPDANPQPQSGLENSAIRESTLERTAHPSSRRAPEPSAHSLRSRLRAPALQPPRPIAGPVPMEPPLSGRPLSPP